MKWSTDVFFPKHKHRIHANILFMQSYINVMLACIMFLSLTTPADT